MSDHAWVLENLAAYLAGGLEPDECERLELHTAGCEPCTVGCEPCAAALTEARDVDAALTGLFADARPSPALEDHIIQSLRARKAEAGLRLPVPGWLVMATAALLLVGVTGAVASQLLVQGELSVPGVESRNQPKALGSVVSERDGESHQDANQLALDWRERMLGELGGVESNQLVFYPPPQALSVKAASTIHKRGSSLARTPATILGLKEQPKPASPTTPSSAAGMGDGSVSNMQRQLNGATPAPNGNMSTSGMSPYLNILGGSAAPATGLPPATAYRPLAPSGQPGGHQPNALYPGQILEYPPSPKEPTKQPPTSGSGSSLGVEPLNRPLIVDSRAKDIVAIKQPDKPDTQPGPRKIVIRTGKVEYEVSSFDAAVATITRLLKNIKGGFIATVNSDKLPNGKVRGSVDVRVPPESLDALMLDLRTELSKGGELKKQSLGSEDISKKYTDLESRLKAARAMEERLLQIIKNGKGEIKDLLAVEKELGEWRSRIEEIEGSLRFYAHQVALSTLTITLYEKEIQAPYGIIETERVQMGLEVEEVDPAFQAAQKAVREAKGRITKSEMKQHSQGQFSAILQFEVAPDAAGPLRDRLKQLGTVARLDIDRLEQTEGGTGKPSDGKIKRSDTQFLVSFYNLTDVLPRETVTINLACVDVEATLKTLLARVDKAAGRVLTSNLTSGRSDQTQGDLQFQVKTPVADAVLDDVKKAGEVMRLQVTENPNAQNTTRKKRGFHIQLLAQEAAAARETDEVQLACSDVPASYRAVQEAIVQAKGRVRNAQLNEQDRRNVTATLDFDIRRADEAVLRAALAAAGDVYTRTVTRAADSDNVLDSKVHWQVKFINVSAIPPRETYVFGVEVADVDQTAAVLSALVGERQGRVVESNVGRERSGRVTAKLIYDVPLAKVHELIDQLKSAGSVRVQHSAKHPEIPDSPLAVARLDVTLSNKELIVPSDEGIGTNVRGGLADSVRMLGWSLRILIFGLCIVLPWALVVWAIYRLVVRLRRRSAPAS